MAAAAVAQAALISAIWATFSAIFSAVVTSLAIYSAAEEDETATDRCGADVRTTVNYICRIRNRYKQKIDVI